MQSLQTYVMIYVEVLSNRETVAREYIFHVLCEFQQPSKKALCHIIEKQKS